MENLYEVLECSENSTYDEMKRQFNKLAKVYHPDKQQKPCTSENDSSVMFTKISHAWKILGNEEMRRHFDKRWRERCLVQDWPIQDNVPIEEFYAEDSVHEHPCRCGGVYSLTTQDIYLKLDLVCCDTCSLCISVCYYK